MSSLPEPRLSAGEPSILITSANRDSDQFLDPDEFDVERNPIQHSIDIIHMLARPQRVFTCLTTFFHPLTQRFPQLQPRIRLRIGTIWVRAPTLVGIK